MRNIVLVLFFALLVGGCAEDNGNTIKGTAEFYRSTESPHVGIIDWDDVWPVELATTELRRVNDYVGDRRFVLAVPLRKAQWLDIIIYNDVNGNGRYDHPEEFIGIYRYYLSYNHGADRWRIVDEYGEVIYLDATKLGYEDIFIRAQYTRSPGGIEELLKARRRQ